MYIPYVLTFSWDETYAFLQSGTPSANILICEYLEQVLRNRKNGRRTVPFAPLSSLYWIKSTNMDNASLDIS